MLPDRRHYVLLPLTALLAVLPLILRGCSCGHDFDFHIISWFEAARQFSHGVVHPHWAFTPAWNAGEPRFVFYPPLSWTLGALLGLVMPWTWTPIVYTWLALTAAGFALHYAVRSFTTPSAALIAATAYIVNPYTLYTAYERTAYAELLAAVWLPLLLYGAMRGRVTIPRIAIPIALLWLTNAPAAVMGCYALAIIALLRLALSFRYSEDLPERLRFVATTTAGTLLGLGLASFYIVPAAYERRFVQIAFAILPGMNPQDNFLFRHTADADHDNVLRTASWLALVFLALTAAILLYVQLRSARPDTVPAPPRRTDDAVTPHLPLLLVALTLLIAFMLTPVSALLWNYLPQLRFLQFPWRLLAILAVIFAFGVALVFSRIAVRPGLTALLLAAVFIPPAYSSFQQLCYPEDTLPERLSIFLSANPGTDPTDEYTPTTADNDALAQANPAYWLTNDESSAPARTLPPAPAPHQLNLTLADPQILVLNLRDYPAWAVTRNGSPVTTRLHRDDGLIAFALPAGASHIEIAWRSLNDQRIGYLLSALSLLLLTGILALRVASSTDVPPLR
jgi:uncharacterized membrane protein